MIVYTIKTIIIVYNIKSLGTARKTPKPETPISTLTIQDSRSGLTEYFIRLVDSVTFEISPYAADPDRALDELIYFS